MVFTKIPIVMVLCSDRKVSRDHCGALPACRGRLASVWRDAAEHLLRLRPVDAGSEGQRRARPGDRACGKQSRYILIYHSVCSHKFLSLIVLSGLGVRKWIVRAQGEERVENNFGKRNEITMGGMNSFTIFYGVTMLEYANNIVDSLRVITHI